MEKKYNITGMGCAMCQARIQDGISKFRGVNKCEVNLLTNSMVVDFDEKIVSSKEICDEVSNLGYGAEEDTDSEPHPERVEKNLSLLKRRLLLSLIFTVPLFIVSMVESFKIGITGLIGNSLFLVIELLITCIVIFINIDIYKSGIKSLFNLAPNMDALVSIGTIASISILYFDSVCMILSIITLGKFLEEKAKSKTTTSLKELASLIPDTARVIRDDKEYIVNPKVIKVGEIIIVKPGESIPLDGIVLEGSTSVNESIITGESEAIIKEAGSNVIGGTINLNGYIKYKVTSVGRDTMLSKIIKMVDEASNSKAPISRIADKVALYFVPTVIGLSVITFIVWINKGIYFKDALNYAISVLVVSCPCALGLATPVSIMVGMGKGASLGVLFKSATALENLGKVDKICFDKTGTITEGIVLDKSLDERLKGSSEIVDTKSDKIRPEAKEVISKIKELGIKVVLISGDKEIYVKEIANLIGIDKYYYSVLPNEKDEIIKKEKEKNKIISMVGDGVNDIVAMERSDIPIAMGTGTDIAISKADLILLDGDLKGLLKALNLSRATLKNIKFSLFWAFFYNVICIPIAAGLLSGIGLTLNPMIAASLMSISSITVVTNALRLRSARL